MTLPVGMYYKQGMDNIHIVRIFNYMLTVKHVIDTGITFRVVMNAVGESDYAIRNLVMLFVDDLYYSLSEILERSGDNFRLSLRPAVGSAHRAGSRERSPCAAAARPTAASRFRPDRCRARQAA